MNAECGKLNEKHRPMTSSSCIIHRCSFLPHRSSFIVPRFAFTLIELMIAIALMLLLMVGVNLIFRTSGQAVGTGQAISQAMRSAQAAQRVMQQDFNAMALRDSPCILLFSRPQPAFRNRADELADRDGDMLTIDIDGDNQEGEPGVPGEIISPATYNFRNHRTDIFSFFARGMFRRQTGNDGTYVADMASNEAWIWYGHLNLYNGTGNLTAAGSYPEPGSGTSATNPNNYYSTQWILGRACMLLLEKTSDTLGTGTLNTGGGAILDSAGVRQGFVDRNWTFSEVLNMTNSQRLAPLEYNTGTGSYTTDGGYAFPASSESCRFDVFGVTIDGFRTRLRRCIDFRKLNGDPNWNWWSNLFATKGRRFQSNPFVLKPLDAARFSQQSPIFLPTCTQFIVEYAGDFVEQDNDPTSTRYGWVTNMYSQVTPLVQPATDGVIDYFVDSSSGTPLRKIRWYGLPRDADGDGRVLGYAPGRNNNVLVDVVPLRDVIKSMSEHPGVPNPVKGIIANPLWAAPIEKLTVFTSAPPPNLTLALRAEYTAAGAAGMQSDEYYTCAWGPYDTVRPSMIRIIVTIDDPNGRLLEGQTYEFVFRVQ